MFVFQIWVIGVEFFDINRQFEVQSFMQEQGYSKDRVWNKGTDIIFVHESYQSLYKPSNQTRASPSTLPGIPIPIPVKP